MVTTRDYRIGTHDALLGQTLPRLFEAAVSAGPDRPAFVDGGRVWTWAEWWDATEAVARGLQERGVRTGDVVVAQVPNNWEFLVTHTAVAAVGGVLLPVHLGNGTHELLTALRRSGARAVVVPENRLTPEIAGLCPVVLVSDPADESRSLSGLLREFEGATPLPTRVRPGDPFMLLPSSGTTSRRPKICLHSHDGLLSNAAAVTAASRPSTTDNVISASPFTHLFGLLSIHLSLYARTTQLLLPGWDTETLISLARAATGPVVLFAVPTQLRDLVNRLAHRDPDDRIRLREVRTGGSKVPSALVTDLRRICDASLVVQWGMSELGAGLFTSADDAPEAATRGIGRPVPGARVRVVGEDGAEAAPGVAGEMWVSSPYSFRGYLGEPELSERVLPADGWLRTGDLASVEAGGLVAFHGRAAELINVGGQKVNAVEVEELLADLPGLGPVAVIGRPDPRVGEYPCLVVTSESAATVDAVAAHLAAKGAAAYKVPAELIVVDAIPRTPTGKIARGRLADLAAAAGEKARSPLAGGDARGTSSMVELVLARLRSIIGDDPGRPDAAPDRAFRESGIDSLGAVRLAGELTAAAGLPVTSMDVFDHATPAALGGHLANLAAGRVSPVVAPSPRPERAAAEDPVVVVGMGCRLPGGVRSPDDLWRLLIDERDAMGPYPADRDWPETGLPGSTGGFLDDIAGFDAEFFGIAPVEARAMDPQQRLLLEVTWEALGHAAIDPASLRDTQTGVFVGMMSSDYRPRLSESPGRYDGNLLIGNSTGVASGRIAYLLGLRGQAVTVDTACSSSLVALHQAARAIRDGECERAIVGGVTLMPTPATIVDFHRQGVLAPDGRCKPFAAGADGVGWSEGVAVVVLERSSEARRNGRRILAVVRGSAINSDGASNGLTAPNGFAQQAVIRQALADARLGADDVQAVEAHGTGTPIGDPIEARALLATYGAGRTGPLWLGSIKSNIGHTQAVSGLVGVLKMILAIQHGLLPATLHAEAPTDRIDWSAGTVGLLAGVTTWPDGEAPRRAGISSFGISGTNAHVIIEQPAAGERPAGSPAGRPAPWLLSAASENALREMAAQFHEMSARAVEQPEDIAHTLARSRASLPHRAVVFPDDKGDHGPALAALAAGTVSEAVVEGRDLGTGMTVFVFSGQGQQWQGMARALAENAPVFAGALAECDAALQPHLGWSVADLLLHQAPEPPAHRVDVVQVALFTTMVALNALWQSYGVRPEAVAGHSQGEIAAAYAAGALSLSDAARIAAVRGRLLRELSGQGRMASILLPAQEVAKFLVPFGEKLSIAAVNGPRSVVISGDPEAIEDALARLKEQDVSARAIDVDYASHSRQVDRLLPRLRAELEGIKPRAGAVPFFSTVTGEQIDTRSLTPDYWCRNLREMVNLRQATRTMIEHGCRRFIEVSAHPVLADAIEQILDESSGDGIVVTTLRRDDGGLSRFLRSVAKAYTSGATLDRNALLGSSTGRLADLPAYPFQHRRFWPSESPVVRIPAHSPETTTRPVLDSPASLMALVREQAATVAGYAGIESIAVDRTFSDLGFTSLTTTELRERLSRATGLRLPATVTLDHRTPGALGSYLATRMVSEIRTPPSDLSSLYQLGCAHGHPDAAIGLIKAAARIRPRFDRAGAAPRTPSPVILSQGSGRLRLVCLPSVTPSGGPAEFDSWRTPLSGRRDATVLPEPGFGDGEPLPADLATLLDLQAAAVTALGEVRDTVLCGHSSGGWIAHALAGRLAEAGLRPAGLILLDSFFPDQAFSSDVLPRVLSRLAQSSGDTGPSASRLTAAGAYLEMLSGWSPQALDVPTLFISAREPLGDGMARAGWRLPCERNAVAGNHFTMMTEHAGEIVTLVDNWLTGRENFGPLRAGDEEMAG